METVKFLFFLLLSFTGGLVAGLILLVLISLVANLLPSKEGKK